MKTSPLTVLVACILLSVGFARAQDPYVVTVIDVPFPHMLTAARGINDLSQIVGVYVEFSGRQHGFIYTNGTFTPVDVPVGINTQARGINNRGNIVGFFEDDHGAHGFLYNNGSFNLIDVPFPGATGTAAYGINDHGDIVGTYSDPTGFRGFLYNNGNFTTIHVTGSHITSASRINNKGQIVGYFNYASGEPVHGFVFEKGKFTILDIPLPSTSDTSPLGINDKADIVGPFQTRTASSITGSHGFIYSKSSFVTIEVRGGINPSIWDINNRGQIVGDYYVNSVSRGFVASLRQ